MIQYRVTVTSIADREQIALEQFEARSDAEKCFEDFQREEDNILDTVVASVGAVTVALEEFCNGQWTYVTKRIVGV